MASADWFSLDDLVTLGQHTDINDLRTQMDRMQIERDLANWDIRKIREVADELLELQLRHGLLVRLLIAKGVITAEEYAGMIKAARVKPAGI